MTFSSLKVLRVPHILVYGKRGITYFCIYIRYVDHVLDNEFFPEFYVEFLI